MRKADSLRDWLTACLPDYKAHPDRLQIFLEGGTISARQSDTLSFVYGYTVKVLFMDYRGDADHLTVPVLAWIAREQPQLLRRADSQPFSFEAELLDSETSDIEISIELTESVVVTPSPDGKGYAIEHPPEPTYDSFGVSASFAEITIGNEPLLIAGNDD
jgi:hypothetical protein